MANIIYEVVKEYVIHVEGLDFPVKGRVLKRHEPSKDDFTYMWEISHYCKPEETAIGVYIPSLNIANSFEEVEHMLLRYMRKFTNIGVKASDY